MLSAFICLYILYPIPYTFEKLLKRLLANYHCATAVVRVETERGGIFKAAVEKENDVVVGVVD